MADVGAGEANATLAVTPSEPWDSVFETGDDISISSSSGGLGSFLLVLPMASQAMITAY